MCLPSWRRGWRRCLPGPAVRMWFDDILLCNYRFIFKISSSPKVWKYHTILITSYVLQICRKCASKIKFTWLFAFVRTYQKHELAYFCYFYAFDAIKVYHYVYYSCISRVSYNFLKKFALIIIHEISLILCDYGSKSQNIVWLSCQITKYCLISCGSHKKISLGGDQDHWGGVDSTRSAWCLPGRVLHRDPQQLWLPKEILFVLVHNKLICTVANMWVPW